jgi:hypothetical protein
MSFIERIAKRVFDEQTIDLMEILAQQKTRILELEAKVRPLQVKLNNTDDSFVYMTKEQLIGLIKTQLGVVRADLDDKLAGVLVVVSEKMANRNGGIPAKEAAEMFQKIAVLERIKDKTEHRRPTAELLEKRQELKDKGLELDRTGKHGIELDKIVAQINFIDWVLGGK